MAEYLTLHQAAKAVHNRLTTHHLATAVQQGLLPYTLRPTKSGRPPQYMVVLKDVEALVERVYSDDDELAGKPPGFSLSGYQPERKAKLKPMTEERREEIEKKRKLDELQQQRWLSNQCQEVWE